MIRELKEFWASEIADTPAGEPAKITLIRAGRSKNGNIYSEAALEAAANLYSGIPAMLDHAEGVGSYSVRDLAGYITEAAYADGAITGKLHTLTSESGKVLAALIEDERRLKAAGTLGSRHLFGFSQVVQAKGSETPSGDFMVEQVTQVLSVDAVVFPAAGGALLEAISGSTDLPLAPRTRAWDGDAAESRIRAWATSNGEVDFARYRRAFFWYDSEAPDNFGSYKLGFADIIDGELTAVPRGIFAVAGVLEGSRGGVDIPAADKARVRTRVERYYVKMREEFDDSSLNEPWANESVPEKSMEKTEQLLTPEQVKDVVSAAVSAAEGELKAIKAENASLKALLEATKREQAITELFGRYNPPAQLREALLKTDMAAEGMEPILAAWVKPVAPVNEPDARAPKQRSESELLGEQLARQLLGNKAEAENV